MLPSSKFLALVAAHLLLHKQLLEIPMLPLHSIYYPPERNAHLSRSSRMRVVLSGNLKSVGFTRRLRLSAKISVIDLGVSLWDCCISVGKALSNRVMT